MTPNAPIQNPKSKIQNPPRSRYFTGAQTTLELVVFIAVLVASLLWMRIYLKRGLAGRLRSTVDSLGEQYDPRATTSNLTLRTKSNTTSSSRTLNEPDLALAVGCAAADLDGDGNCTDAKVFGTLSTSALHNDTTTRSGTETVGVMGNRLWD